MILPLLLAALAAATAPLPSDPLPGDWRAIPDDELLVMTLAGNHKVTIRLAAHYVPQHAEQVRALARAHWWDQLSVYRVQENWVAQWGDQSEKKRLPAGVASHVAPEFEIGALAPAQRLPRADAYSSYAGMTADGWPIASNGTVSWLTHCYGSVGVARDAAPDSGSGAELFTPIGQSARRLDRNYTVVGRVIEGMEYLSALPRSSAEMGMYPAGSSAAGISSVRLVSDLPPTERPHFQYRATDNARYAAMIARKVHPASPMVATGVEVCDLPVGVRRTP